MFECQITMSYLSIIIFRLWAWWFTILFSFTTIFIFHCEWNIIKYSIHTERKIINIKLPLKLITFPKLIIKIDPRNLILFTIRTSDSWVQSKREQSVSPGCALTDCTVWNSSEIMYIIRITSTFYYNHEKHDCIYTFVALPFASRYYSCLHTLCWF